MRSRLVTVLVVGFMTSFGLAAGGAASAASGWRIIPSPNVGSLSNGFAGVSALSSTDAWAVGTSQSDSGVDFHTLGEHWNGRTWSVVTTPDPGTLARLNG